MRARAGSRGSARQAPWRLGRGERGVALLEFAIVTSLLLMMVLGVIEYGNMFSRVHTLTSLSREGANLAARGATLVQARDNVVANGADIGLASRGGVIVSRVALRDGAAEIEDQVATSGYAANSRLGPSGGPAANVEPWGLVEDQIVYAVEIFYDYEAVTPFDGATGVGIPETLYEIGVF